MSTKKQNNRRILDEVSDVIRLHHYSIHTERSYLDWIKRFILFHNMKSRDDLVDGEDKITAFLTHLAVERNVAPATQNQAMNALVFLYKKVLKVQLDKEINAVRSARKVKIPTVLSREEVADIIAVMDGVPQLVVKLLYGSGLRINEALRLRVKDVDFQCKQVVVRSGKGAKDRVTTFPASLIPFLGNHMELVRKQHEIDLENGLGEVYLPNALSRKYRNAGKEWPWQYVFPSRKISVDPRSGRRGRHHVDPSVINKAVKASARKVGISKRVTPHTFRHSFATHLLQRGTDIRTIQALLGHNDVSTTMIYTHILQQGGHGVTSPLDDLVGIVKLPEQP